MGSLDTILTHITKGFHLRQLTQQTVQQYLELWSEAQSQMMPFGQALTLWHVQQKRKLHLEEQKHSVVFADCINFFIASKVLWRLFFHHTFILRFITVLLLAILDHTLVCTNFVKQV
jgi:hypothetical protein